MIVWVFWLCTAVAVGSALIASYLKYGEELGIVKGKQKLLLVVSGAFLLAIIGLGYILFFSPYGASQESPSWVPFLWASVFLILIGAVVASFSVRAGQIGLLKKELAAKWFKAGYGIATIGSALLLYAFLPGNLVP